MRKTYEELQAICDDLKIDKLYSWSRINCWHNSHYEYFLKYILKEKGLRNDCCYAPLGGMAHELLEDFYEHRVEYKDMFDKFDDMWMVMIDISQLKFDRNDSTKNINIQTKYYNDLKHYFKNFIPIDKDVEIEKFITIKITPEIVLQGYIDIIIKEDDNKIIIGDYKTSTKYTGAKKINESGQLVLYALGMSQLGVPLDKIKIAWNFLKYVKVTTTLKNGKTKDREIERSKLGESLRNDVTKWLKQFEYNEDEIKDYLADLVDTNDLSCLPKEIQEKYILNDCWSYIDLSQELIDKWVNHVIDTIKITKELEEQYKETGDRTLFYDSPEDVAANSYYYATLCEYSSTQLPPYKNYLDELEKKKNGLDLFENVGAAYDDDSNNDKSTNDEKFDLSWLDALPD